MATPKETLWKLEPHTTAKHEILRRYLAAWFPILGTHYERIVCIDGFAGPGRYGNGEAGSPLIALEVATNHRRSTTGKIVFWFIEERDDRLAHLKQELASIEIPAHFEVSAEAGRFHEKFGAVLDAIEADECAVAPTFAFIDPFGFSGIPFSVIERLLKHRRCEAFITFMVDAINRFLEHPQDKVLRHIADMFGDARAVEIAKESGNRIDELRRLYQSKLSSVAKYVRYFEMRDRQDRPQYYLFFASNSERGHIKMKESMWKVNPDGDFRFSDATNPHQTVLFDNDPARVLAAQLREEFRSEGAVTGLCVRTFVENRTAFLKKHMTGALRQGERSGHLQVEDREMGGEKRRASSYPDDARLTWV